MSTTQVLARKWRPKRFSELTGQEHVVKALTNALEQQRLHHAYLFTGTRGVGKTTVARILAKALNCETGITPDPCGKCSACLEIDSGRFVDLLELDAASNTGIDNMREVLDNAQYLPTSGRFKVYIIDEVHMLSTKAFNSMLKTLEEPPEHVKFILATTDPQKIPVTVLSRCLQFNLKQIPEPLIQAHLAKVLGDEDIIGEPKALSRIARAARGSMRDALSLLDQAIAYSGGRVEDEVVRNMLGAVDQDYLYAILDALAEKDGAKLVSVAEGMEERSLEFEAALQDLGVLLHKIALFQIVPEAMGGDMLERDRISDLAAKFDPEEIQLLYQIATHGRNEIGFAPDEYSGFSMTLIRMLAFMPGERKPVDAGQAVEVKLPVAKPPAVKPEKAPEPAPEPTPEPAGALDWVSLSGKLNLSGMAKMLAQHSALQHFDGHKIEFVVPFEHKHLMDKLYQDRVKAALCDYLGKPVELSFAVGEGVTPAKVEVDQKHERQMEAVASIEQDPVVRNLVDNFDAKLIESSIKPIQGEKP
ncbi:MAG: DNA polymerase III subunit gamma/tau [Burkholderiales bacterium]